MLVDLKVFNLISIQILDENNELVESINNCYQESNKAKVILQTKRLYKEKINNYFYNFT